MSKEQKYEYAVTSKSFKYRYFNSDLKQELGIQPSGKGWELVNTKVVSKEDIDIIYWTWRQMVEGTSGVISSKVHSDLLKKCMESISAIHIPDDIDDGIVIAVRDKLIDVIREYVTMYSSIVEE
jgi:hypothetical protein